VAPASPPTLALAGFEAAEPAVLGLPRQQSLADLGTPLSETTFVVLDLETTGGSAAIDAITEIGALKLRGGELLGRFESLVNPGIAIPPTITVLTGITESMVLPAPRIAELLPPLLEFTGDSVIVGHNVRFDCSFIDAALVAHGYPRLANRRVDTLALARRLVRDELPNLRLHTLARHFRTSVEPVHRAYADAAATAEVLHALLERAASYGVLGLDDLLALPSMRAHPSAAKLALTARLPRKPGVYLFRDRDHRVLYVGKATNLRARVRSYFASDDRRKVPQLLRELATIEHRVCATPFEAEIREQRLIRRLQPRFNRQGKAVRGAAYLKITDERFPRLLVSRTPPSEESGLGPFRSTAVAHVVREAIETAIPLRRCAIRVGRRAPIVPGPACVPAQLGVASCPCRGHVDEETYAGFVARVRQVLTATPDVALSPLERRMNRLADDERFEEAAATRDRLDALARALDRRRTVSMWRGVTRAVMQCDGQRIEIRRGVVLLPDDDPEELAGAPGPGGRPLPLPTCESRRCEDSSEDSSRRDSWQDDVGEILVVDRWMRRNAGRLRIGRVEGELVSAWPRIVVGIEPRTR